MSWRGRVGVFLAALLLAIGRPPRAIAQVDTSRHPPADTSARDTTKDTIPIQLPVLPTATPDGPLPRGSRYTFTLDSIAFSDTRTLSDLLAHVPGVYVARGGLYGQAETVLYGGRGAAALEIYWDGLPYLPAGRDSVFVDPARIPLAPLERVDVVVLPATLRVYLVTARQGSSVPTTEVGILTGVLGTAGYRGTFLKRWRSGVGLSLIADWNSITGAQNTSSTAYHDVDLWLKGEYIPTARFGASFQILSSDWNRSANSTPPPSPPVDPFHSRRRADVARVFVAARADGLGPRLDLSVATTGMGADSVVPARSLWQGSLALSSLWRRASASVTVRRQSDPDPFQLEAHASWNPLLPLTLSVDGRHATYRSSQTGNRAHLAVGLELPFGFSAHGDLAWAKDLDAPARTDALVQRTSDLFGAVRWDSRWATLDVGGAKRGAFIPTPDFPAGLLTVSSLALSPATNYLVISARLRPAPGLELSGWYWNPVRGGADFEPPHHARYSLTFYSKFWRVYRSGIFALRLEGAAESWTGGGGAGLLGSSSSTVTPLALSGATFVDLNVQIRIAGVTIFWANRNARGFPGGYVPAVSYPSNYQYYGVRWRFTN